MKNIFFEKATLDKIKNAALRGFGAGWISTQIDMIEWRKNNPDRYANWCYSSLTRYEFSTLMVHSKYQDKPMTVSRIMDFLQITRKTADDLIKTCLEEGWIEAVEDFETGKASCYQAHEQTIERHLQAMVVYVQSIKSQGHRETYMLFEALDQYSQKLNQQSVRISTKY